MRPFRPAGFRGAPGGRFVIVADRDDFKLPAVPSCAEFDNAVAGMRRTLFGDMRGLRRVLVGRTADAAGIEDDRPVPGVQQSSARWLWPQSRMRQPGSSLPSRFRITRDRRPDEPRLGDRSPSDSARHGRAWHGRREPPGATSSWTGRAASRSRCSAVSRSKANLSDGPISGSGSSGDAAVVIAAHRRPAERVQPFHRLARPQRSGDAVAEIDEKIGAAAPGEIGEHGFEREDVAVDVGKDGYSHAMASG